MKHKYGKENEQDVLIGESRGWKIYKRKVAFPSEKKYYAIDRLGSTKVNGDTAEDARTEAILS